MFIDARSLPDGEALSADIAIVGAGAAGISLAIALEGAGLKVALIESGGLEWSEEAQDLAAGELGAQVYATPETVRLRWMMQMPLLRQMQRQGRLIVKPPKLAPQRRQTASDA